MFIIFGVLLISYNMLTVCACWFHMLNLYCRSCAQNTPNPITTLSHFIQFSILAPNPSCNYVIWSTNKPALALQKCPKSCNSSELHSYMTECHFRNVANNKFHKGFTLKHGLILKCLKFLPSIQNSCHVRLICVALRQLTMCLPFMPRSILETQSPESQSGRSLELNMTVNISVRPHGDE